MKTSVRCLRVELAEGDKTPKTHPFRLTFRLCGQNGDAARSGHIEFEATRTEASNFRVGELYELQLMPLAIPQHKDPGPAASDAAGASRDGDAVERIALEFDLTEN